MVRHGHMLTSVYIVLSDDKRKREDGVPSAWSRYAPRDQLFPEALRHILALLHLVVDKNIISAEGSLRDHLPTDVLNLHDTAHILYMPAHPAKPQDKQWLFSPGTYIRDSTMELRWVPFQRMQHVVHDMSDVLKILTEQPGKATFIGFKGRRNKVFDGPDLWWLVLLNVNLTDAPQSHKLTKNIRVVSLLSLTNSKINCHDVKSGHRPI
jgi:hypothetical protein